MSKSGININVFGGSAAVGNVSQGDSNQLHAYQTNHIEDDDFDRFYKAIDNMVANKTVPRAEYLALKAEVEWLQLHPSPAGVIGSIKALYEKYAWAATPFKALLGVVLA